MRVIEYRAIEHNTNRWRYGYLAEIETAWDNYGGYGLPVEYKKVLITTDYTTRCDTLIKEDTIGQFTGFRDKSGVKIYEGDILLYVDNTHKEVVWDKGSFKVADIKFPNRNLYLLEYCYDNCYVVGNIHDDNELIKEIKERIDYGL